MATSLNSSPASRPRLASVAWSAVSIDDAFWNPRVRLNRERGLAALYRQCLTSGRINALRLAWRPGMHPLPHQFWDSDVAKWLEASSYSLATHPDPALEAAVESVVQLLQSAQQADGYLNSYFTTVEPDARWTDLRDGHELYCAGHLIEAGVAHFLATGRRSLLDVVCRYADHIASVFGTAAGQKRGYCGHPEIELALVRLYQATHEPRYLELSQYFVDERGREPNYFDHEATLRTRPRANDGYYRRHGLRGPELRTYNQSHAPVRDQREVVGHAVRAMYLYSAMADLATETGDVSLQQACERLWSHLMSTRVYVTGGIGSSAHNEGFSGDYDLPNASAYAETCAAVGLVFWASRMFHLTHDGRYTDVLERALYNCVAGAIGADGDHFFYANPLASQGQTHRQTWFECACCPPNVARVLGSLGQYIYSHGDDHIAVHLFVGGSVEVQVAGEPVRLRQETNYPWQGRVRLTIELTRPTRFGLWLRVPGWSQGATVRVNGCRVPRRGAFERGYLRLHRTWCNGDLVQLDMPMPVERVTAHPAVAADAGCVALQRGPIVYCLEQVDNDQVPLHTVLLPSNAPVSANFDREWLGGVVKLQAQGWTTDNHGWNGRLYRTRQVPTLQPHTLVAVPYAVWDNRAAGQMRVWIRAASP
jgi:DUF1680 family protein